MDARLRGTENEKIAEDASGSGGMEQFRKKAVLCYAVLWISEPLVVNLRCNALMGNFPVGLLAVCETPTQS